jgi:hypothetical protein
MISQNTREATGWQKDPDARRAGKIIVGPAPFPPALPTGKKEGAEEKMGGGR